MSEIPAGAKKPQDHKKSAAQIEAEGGATVTVTWRDMEFEIPADAGQWKATTTLAFEDGHSVTGVRGVLGVKQWDELVKKHDPSNADVNELFTLVGQAMGFEGSGE